MRTGAVRGYLYFSGLIFGAVAALHLVRVLRGWPMEIGPYDVPMEVSWVGAAVPGALCVWAFWLARRERGGA